MSLADLLEYGILAHRYGAHPGDVWQLEHLADQYGVDHVREEYATADLAYVVGIQRSRLKLGGADEFSSVSLRVTTIFRHEDDGWKIVHRHADPITSPRPIESVREQ